MLKSSSAYIAARKMNKLYIVAVFSVSSLLAVSSAQIISIDSCPENIQVVESFNVTQYLGTWYEYAKYPVYFETEGKCVTAQYSLGENGTVAVKNSMVNENNNILEDISGYANLIAPGKLLVKFPVSPVYTVSSNYWVLDTDYDNYTVVYSCNPLSDDSHSTIVWILTREQLPQPEYIEKAAAVLKQNNISLLQLKVTNQLACSN